jgi:hypothetical protein
MPADEVSGFLLRAYRAILKARPIEMPAAAEVPASEPSKSPAQLGRFSD